jgi:cyclic pyranopterin phosphate synthase
MIEKTHGMIDIADKPKVPRTATASGEIILSETSLEAIREKTNPKGDVLENARLAAILAAKKTPELVFMCHQIQLNSVKVFFRITKKSVICEVTVNTEEKTGVEIEAVAGVMNALLAIFDLSKRYEKDPNGQYMTARITNIFVKEKIKGENNALETS